MSETAPAPGFPRFHRPALSSPQRRAPCRGIVQTMNHPSPLGLSILAAIFVALGTNSAQAAAADEQSFFPIMAWNHAPADPAVLARMHECGLTVAGFVAPKDLDLVAAAGMKAIVNDPRVGNYDWEHVDAAAARQKVQSL